ncbi:MAG: GNAT family protein [Patescibacteria group bacterium]|jgi:RimJ/RimL family protein N-acetyltransferase
MEKDRVVFLKGLRGTVLRPMNKETDLDFFYRGINNPEANHYLQRYLPQTKADEEKWFDAMVGRTDRLILAVETPDGELLGSVGLHEIDWRNQVGTMGIALFAKDQWHKGYGKDAVMALLEYAFMRLNLRKVRSKVYSINQRSLALHRSCGGVQEGTARQEIFIDGQFHDVLYFGIFRSEWEVFFASYKEGSVVKKS